MGKREGGEAVALKFNQITCLSMTTDNLPSTSERLKGDHHVFSPLHIIKEANMQLMRIVEGIIISQ